MSARLGPVLVAAAVAIGYAHAQAAEISLRFTPRWVQQDIALPADVENRFGQALHVTRFAALVSGVALWREDGAVVRLDGQFGLIDAAEGRTDVALQNVPAGRYAGVEFEFGLPPEVNHADHGKWPAGHPLNPLVNRLHWNWQGGYVFVALEGRWRARTVDAGFVSAADDIAAGQRHLLSDIASGRGRGFEEPVAGRAGAEVAVGPGGGGFLYHLATESMRVPVRMQMPFAVVEAAGTRLEFAIDLARVLGAQPIGAEAGDESTHSAEGDPIAPKMAAALRRAVFGLGAGNYESERVDGVGAEKRGKRDPLAHARGYLTPWAFVVPAGFPQPELPADNLLTVEGVALGEALFSDRRLSGNGTQSCASCHAPERGFSDEVALSRGAEGAVGKRNAMPLFNLAWSPSFAWDGSQPKVRDQTRAAWTNPIEMNAEPARVVAELARDAALAERFGAAFGSKAITSERVTLALEQFLLSVVSADAKFDRVGRGEVELTEEERRGFELFATEFDPARGKLGADCFHCHGGALFTDLAFKNSGLEVRSADEGLARVTGRKFDTGKFKTPSLRNVAVTGPYMHDGRFATLEAVVAHYDHGVARSATLDPNLAKHPAAGLELSEADQRALVAFLRTLTDARWENAKAGN